MLQLLPRLEHRMDSDKSAEELSQILRSVTDFGKPALSRPENTEFTGTIHLSDFKIVRKISYRNSFLPVIEGTICAKENRTVITLKFRLHWFVRIFLTIWFGMAGFFLLFGLLLVFLEGITQAGLLLVASLFLFFGQVLVRAGFYLPARKTLARLEELLG